ncbi:Spy/CpxP family protein refolding chaperone [Aestuariibius sp. 2305UL40-4]|uniref:Spy/CpxP family protein refolding chaperone n=1 Tax=Aestuariibius violaceus TaxID=3234132 RepID=UPI00345E5F79
MKGAFSTAFFLCAASVLQADTAPYAGLETRDIAALSESDIDDLLAGRGWGFALPAELNGYPGPAHVLEMSDALDLSEEQRQTIEVVRAVMEADAQALGARYVAAEAKLDNAFAAGDLTPEALSALTRDAAAIEADLRAVHLAAHLEIKPLLSAHQVATYNRLRGYEGDAGSGHSGHGNH